MKRKRKNQYIQIFDQKPKTTIRANNTRARNQTEKFKKNIVIYPKMLMDCVKRELRCMGVVEFVMALLTLTEVVAMVGRAFRALIRTIFFFTMEPRFAVSTLRSHTVSTVTHNARMSSQFI